MILLLRFLLTLLLSLSLIIHHGTWNKSYVTAFPVVHLSKIIRTTTTTNKRQQQQQQRVVPESWSLHNDRIVPSNIRLHADKIENEPDTDETSGNNNNDMIQQPIKEDNNNKSEKGTMKRPFLDQFIARTIYQMEMKRVESSSEIDTLGRIGEPMEWSEMNSIPNRFSQLVASNSIGYWLKQSIANMIAGNEYNKEQTQQMIQNFIKEHDVAIFSFTTCPFCRQVKDVLDERKIQYGVIELDLLFNNEGNEIRAQLGYLTKRTSVPSIFIQQQYIGGCNDGTPGLIPLIQSGEFDKKYTPYLPKKQ